MSFDNNASNLQPTAWAIEAAGLGKCYDLFENPSDRLKQLILDQFLIDRMLPTDQATLHRLVGYRQTHPELAMD